MTEGFIESFDNLSIEMNQPDSIGLDINQLHSNNLDSDQLEHKTILKRKNINHDNNVNKSLKICHTKDVEYLHCLHKAGWRETIVIEKKNTYNLTEVLKIIEQIDGVWEKGNKTKFEM